MRNSLIPVEFQSKDLKSFRENYKVMKQYSVAFCLALFADNCGCCMRKNRSIKKYMAGKEQYEKRLDIVKLIRT